MLLSFNEIRARAAKFAKDWAGCGYEKGQTGQFYHQFFEVFGKSAGSVDIYFEKGVKLLGNKQGFIDLFWPGKLLVEQKSMGRSLAAARNQANDYYLALKDEEKPTYQMMSDFQNFELLNRETGEEYSFTLAELPEKVKLFGFIAGYAPQTYKDQDPVNIDAANLMSNLHNRLRDSGYEGTDLERLLVRIMFCLFADDTGIFEPDIFISFIENKTNPDGSDLGPMLVHLFQTLNTPVEKRPKNLDDALAAFPYVNGGLFQDAIAIPSLDSAMRNALLQCCYFHWSKVSPALFGSLFQTIMLPEEQRKKGAHYTSEKNILKTIHPLFLDELHEEFEHLKTYKTGKKQALEKFHDKLARLKFLDPACGCGNFLILAYRELRLLEIEVLEVLYPPSKSSMALDISHFSKIDVDQFYGIEIEEFAAKIAEAAMWLVDHQMNMKLSEKFGQAFVRLPLKKSAKIVNDNALRIDWKDVVSPKELSYILGNPPFIGHHYQSAEQKADQEFVMANFSARGVLDFVCNWYVKAAEYIQKTKIIVAFVSTNSITQGEQASLLWQTLLDKYSIKIHFAHRTFKWTIDEKKASGMTVAGVHAVIIGFSTINLNKNTIFDYENPSSEPQMIAASNISPYLIDAPSVLISTRTRPICNVPAMQWGNKPTDGGHFILSPKERDDFIEKEPNSMKYIRRYMSGGDFINGIERYCLWLKDISPDELRSMPLVAARVRAVRDERLKSKAESTRKYSAMPTIFRQISQPNSDYLAIPEVSSERREIIPIAFLDQSIICSNKIQFVPSATLFHFGILTSNMHMAWMRQVCGRLESRYSYSNTIVYNNFPWPENPTDAQKQDIETKAQAVLDARAKFPNSTLADLYDPLTMPPELLKAHQALDKAVDKAYRKEPFTSERQRVEYLFEQYQKLTAPLLPAAEKKKRKGK